MAFSPMEHKPPIKVQSVKITLNYQAPSEYIDQETQEVVTIPAEYTANYEYVIVDEDGKRVLDPMSSGDLIQHLSSEETQTAKTFMDNQIAKIKSRIQAFIDAYLA